MDQLEYIETIEKDFHGIIKKLFPNNFLQSSGSSGGDFHGHFAKQNLYYQNTDYSYKGDLTFFHLTSYQNLFSILNSRAIRMYNLHNANDPEEFEFSAKLFNPNKQEIDFRKTNIYTFSFCPMSEIKNEKVWAKYGQDFAGVAIIFKIVNDTSKWDNFNLSDIKYNLSPTLETYVKEINALKEKYPGCTFYLELEKIMAFHKKEEWKDEKEVRILTYNPYKNWDERLKFSKRELRIEENRNRFTEYIDLNLWVDNSSAYLENRHGDPMVDRKQNLPTADYFETTPKIVISDIRFGHNCGLTNQEYYKFKIEIEELIRFNFGYKIEMENNLYKF